MADTTESPARAAKGGFRRRLVGKVTSNKMDKTVVVEVLRRVVTSKYHKYIRTRARYQAHDENNQYVPGDLVEIREHRPISKNKCWVVTRLVSGATDRTERE